MPDKEPPGIPKVDSKSPAVEAFRKTPAEVAAGFDKFTEAFPDVTKTLLALGHTLLHNGEKEFTAGLGYGLALQEELEKPENKQNISSKGYHDRIGSVLHILHIVRHEPHKSLVESLPELLKKSDEDPGEPYTTIQKLSQNRGLNPNPQFVFGASLMTAIQNKELLNKLVEDYPEPNKDHPAS